jgi:hypothetical protein
VPHLTEFLAGEKEQPLGQAGYQAEPCRNGENVRGYATGLVPHSAAIILGHMRLPDS